MGYLVISRRIGQRIKIGDDIEILVSDYDEGRIDIGVQAPRELDIKRLPSHAEEEYGSRNENLGRLRKRRRVSKRLQK